MGNNLFIMYDLNTPNQEYTKVIDEIKSLGDWASVQRSTWYVNTAISASDAAQRISKVMDPTDTLLVVDALNNESYWYNLSDEVANHIKHFWNE
ncbi:hypothetical protein ACWLRU_003050 [Vibrio parahaemolyticus]|nr:hypothetical protein [Vibrio parahaemolyticus]EIV8660729.1 hypothetical protein [Vibrio parahaemolyticus]